MVFPEITSTLFQAPDFARPNILLVFGALLTLGVLGAILARNVRMIPTITVFMFLGIVIGPNGIGLIDGALLHESNILIDVALGLILYKLGCDVQLRHLLRSTSIWRVSLVEAVLTFAAVFTIMHVMGSPVLASLLVGAITISSSPAVLVHMAEETHARGPVIYEAKALLTLNNVLSFIAFSLFLPFALGNEPLGWFDTLGIPFYRAVGAIGIGSFVAFLMTQIDRLLDNEEVHFRFALIVGGITVTLGLTSMLHISSLFAALTLGIVTRWLERQRQGLSTVELGASGDLFFIVLFVMAGANFHLGEVFKIGSVALAIAMVRGAAKILALFVSRDREQDRKTAFALGLMLTPMGALAIGLAQTLQNYSPATSAQVLSIVFSMVALLETFGPFAVNAAIRITGESPLYRNAAASAATENPKEQGAESLPVNNAETLKGNEL